MPVTYPQIEETTKRALHAVIAPYFAAPGVSTQQISGTDQDFYRADLDFDVLRVNEEQTLPRIVITGSRTTSHDYKVNDPKTVKRWGGTQRQAECTRTIFISLAKSMKVGVPPYNTTKVQQANWRDADRIWGQLFLICKGLQDRWAQENIYQMDLESNPRQLADPNYFILSGQMSFQLRFEYTK